MIFTSSALFYLLGLSATISVVLSLAFISLLLLKSFLKVVSNFQFEILDRVDCQRYYPELAPLIGDLSLHGIVSTKAWPSIWAVFHVLNKRYLIINTERWIELNTVEKKVIIDNFFKEKDFYFSLLDSLFLLFTYAPKAKRSGFSIIRIISFFYYHFMVSLQGIIINSKQNFLSERTWIAKKILSKYNTEKRISF